ncbi:MAG TPA: c-type cytochrome [Castellaniella sp.]|jgi:thiosulfate dehydrogenase|nr:c-type cytochrome [Castellaniella sp.]
MSTRPTPAAAAAGALMLALALGTARAASPDVPAFTPPPADAIPSGPFGEAVRRGQDIFLNPQKFAGQYVGNSMACVSCHLDAGRRAGAGPLWAAYVLYPAYRSKNGHVNTLAERLQGCFIYSMNGRMPPADSKTIVALESYMYWMAKGAPTGVKLAGQGFPELAEPQQTPDYIRGQKVYTEHCALCHDAQGKGRQDATEHTVFPALWGDDSYNWGAGMHSIKTAAAFIHANMPLSRGGTLSEQEAWDVAYFIDAHERPQDPRFAGNLAATTKAHHGGKYDLYGQTVNGVTLGAHSKPSTSTLPDKAEQQVGN